MKQHDRCPGDLSAAGVKPPVASADDGVRLESFLTLSEAAQLLRLGPDTVDRLVRMNSLPFIHLTDLGQHRPGARSKKLIRFARTSLIRWMLSRERPVAGHAAGFPPAGGSL